MKQRNGRKHTQSYCQGRSLEQGMCFRFRCAFGEALLRSLWRPLLLSEKSRNSLSNNFFEKLVWVTAKVGHPRPPPKMRPPQNLLNPYLCIFLRKSGFTIFGGFWGTQAIALGWAPGRPAWGPEGHFWPPKRRLVWGPIPGRPPQKVNIRASNPKIQIAALEWEPAH